MEFKVNTLETAPKEAIDTLNKVKSAYGFVPNLIGVFSNSPEAAEAYVQISKLFDSTSLSATEKQVVLLATSVENTCSYCVAAHTVISGLQRVPQDVVEAIRNGKEIADSRLEALRRYTSEVTVNRGRASDETAKRFVDAGYTEKNALEVLLGITQKTLSNYVNHVAETPLDAAFKSGEWQGAGSTAVAA